MTESPSHNKGLAVVALAFDDRKEVLVQSAISLARRFGMSLKLIHGVEPPVYDTMVVETPTIVSIPTPILEETARQIKERRMEMTALVERLKKLRIDVSADVIEGDAVRSIISCATNLRANLILTACHPEKGRFLPQGLSTALSLMHEAPLPVLVVGDSPIDFEAEHFRILVADDLQQSTQEAVRKCYELASHMPGSHVRHVHIHGDFREMLKETWQDLREKIPGLKEVAPTPETVWREDYEARLLALRRQSMPFRLSAEKNKVFIEPDVRTGSVQKEIENVVTEFKPQLAVFGRHRLLKTKPFLIGRVPLRTMVEFKNSILLVPPRDDLYSTLPFPAASP